jgi:arginyl-tRNA synthetase
MNLLETIRAAFRPVLVEMLPDTDKLGDFLAMVKPAQNPEHGDYQANFAMPIGKLLKRKPPEVAADFVARLPKGDFLESASVAGPGFINIRLHNDWLARNVRAMAADDRLGIAHVQNPKTYVIDYSGPNVAKPLHVGHLRSTIIGESLCRLLRFMGHKVIGDNHLGDWGTQFGMLLFGYKNLRNKENFKKDPVRELAALYVEVRKLAETFGMLQLGYEKFRDPQAFESNPIHELARLYVKGLERKRNKSESDDDDDEGPTSNPIADAYRNETVKLHQGDPENVGLWKQFMPACMEEVETIYRRLDVHFDHQYGESHYHSMLPAVVTSLLEKGIAQRSEGAVIIQGANNTVALIQKRDGAYTYTTTDLATIRFRMDSWKPEAMLYVVDFRQGDHFKNLFAAARSWGFDKVELSHVSFGSVLGKDGKPLQTRAGGATELGALLDRAVHLGGQQYQETRLRRLALGQKVTELTDEEIDDIAETIGIGAIKYADLSQNRTSDYKYDEKKMLAMDGNTATYMQYAYVRCHGIFREGGIDESQFRTNPPPILLNTAHERALALQLLRFEEFLTSASEEYLPHYLTGYLWDLAKAYSGFFENCHVLKAETAELRASRLVLCDLTARTIQLTLKLLGIKTVERM